MKTIVVTPDIQKTMDKIGKKNLKDKVEKSWQEYKNGKIISHEDLTKRYEKKDSYK